MRNLASSSPEPGTPAWWTHFQALLDDQNDWPAHYTFKFIAPTDRLDLLKGLFETDEVNVRSSSKGNYVSVTARLQMASSDEVIAIYKEASTVEGVISL